MNLTRREEHSAAETKRVKQRIRTVLRALASQLDPQSWIHVLRILHYYHYTHVSQVRKLTVGHGTRFAPNISLTNAERISIGGGSNIGAHCYLWAGESGGLITIGRGVRLAPNCFLIATNYGTKAGTPLWEQQKEEAPITIGDGVWLGTGVIVLAGVSIGDGAVVAAGAVVTADIPCNVVAGGIPAKVLRQR